MILIFCPRCRVALRVIGDADEAHSLVGHRSEFWPDRFQCFRCSGPAQGFLEGDVSIKTQIEVKEVSPAEAFAAIHGLGIPEEREVDPLVVDTLMREQPVKKVFCKNIPGASRVLVDAIELWDGTRLHFGNSNEGAVIYKITRPHSYADKVSP